MMVTDHFSVGEFACKDGRTYPPDWILDRLRPLCNQLEVIRAAIGGLPIIILSGYRSPEWNQRVGGAKASQHMAGRAADIRVADMSAGLLHAKIIDLHGRGAIQIGGLGLYKTWVHLDVRAGVKLAQWAGTGVVV